MKFSSSLLLLGSLAAVAAAPADNGTDNANNGTEASGTCYMPEPIPELNGTSDFKNIGMMLFPNYDGIDVFGALDALWLMSMGTQKLDLHLIAETMDPVSAALSEGMNKVNSSFGPQIVPTATFADFKGELDLLIIPGGPFTFSPNLTAGVDFVKKWEPKVKILATICTGATVAARAGVLDGKVATTNKQAWESVVKDGPKVKWAAPARYVRDGKFWTASGVTSGIDLIHSFIKAYWGEEQANSIADGIEHIPAGPRDDPFTYKAKNITNAVPLCTEYVGW
jgi:transcriptional regulator GlxA family with amidase domain